MKAQTCFSQHVASEAFTDWAIVWQLVSAGPDTRHISNGQAGRSQIGFVWLHRTSENENYYRCILLSNAKKRFIIDQAYSTCSKNVQLD